MRHFAIAAILAILGFGRVLAGPSEENLAPQKLTGFYVEFCSCERFCESALEGRPACSFVAGLRIEAGQRGGVSLGGLNAALVAPSSSALAQNPGSGAVLYVDRGATAAQGEAIRTILSERFSARIGGPLGPPRPASIEVGHTGEGLTVAIEGVADLRARPFTGSFRRFVQIENAPGTILPFPMLARGTGGHLADASAGVKFDGAGKNVFFGKFDFGGRKGRR